MKALHRFSCDVWQHACFDPGTLLLGGLSIGSQVIGAGLQGAGASAAAGATIAGGNAALQAGQLQKQAADFQAAQLEENAGQSFAAGQRQMLDAQERTRLAISSLRAGAAGNGTNVAVGSNAAIAGDIERRGSYNAAMDMFNGDSARIGQLNQAAGVRLSGEAALIGGQEAQQASLLQAKAGEFNAAGTIAGSAGNIFKSIYGFTNPGAPNKF